MQAAAVRWCTMSRVWRQCWPLHGAAPVAVFEAVEAEALLPLPVSLHQPQ
jgi:hypothetical protein